MEDDISPEQADADQEMFSPDHYSPDSRDAGTDKYESSFIDDSPEHDSEQDQQHDSSPGSSSDEWMSDDSSSSSSEDGADSPYKDCRDSEDDEWTPMHTLKK